MTSIHAAPTTHHDTGEEHTMYHYENHRPAVDERTTTDPAAFGRDDLYTVDPGDSHDKGELSLCVGEAA